MLVKKRCRGYLYKKYCVILDEISEIRMTSSNRITLCILSPGAILSWVFHPSHVRKLVGIFTPCTRRQWQNQSRKPFFFCLLVKSSCWTFTRKSWWLKKRERVFSKLGGVQANPLPKKNACLVVGYNRIDTMFGISRLKVKSIYIKKPSDGRHCRVKKKKKLKLKQRVVTQSEKTTGGGSNGFFYLQYAGQGGQRDRDGVHRVRGRR